MTQQYSLAIPQSGYDAVIFDLDGTLVNSMAVHFTAWCEALAKHGAANVFTEDTFYAMGGLPTKDIVNVLNEELGLMLDPESVALVKRNAFLENLDQVVINEEVVDFARSKRGEMPLAIATGGSRVVSGKTLEATGLSELFDEVITANDVQHGKPAPDIFLEAAERLKIAPERCLVFEDAPAGIKGAQSAGMEVVRVPVPKRGV